MVSSRITLSVSRSSVIRRTTSPHSGPFELDALNRFASTSYRTHCLSPGLAAEEDAELASLADWFSTVAFHSSSPSLAGWLSVVAGAESGADAVGLLGAACVFSSKSFLQENKQPKILLHAA